MAGSEVPTSSPKKSWVEEGTWTFMRRLLEADQVEIGPGERRLTSLRSPVVAHLHRQSPKDDGDIGRFGPKGKTREPQNQAA